MRVRTTQDITDYFYYLHFLPYLIYFNCQMMKTIEAYTYKISENIGKGYSSTVHKGLNDKTGEQVSIKVIEMVKLEDPINQMLLQHQIMALKSLTYSAHVLHLYDVYATKNNTYIITELCEGDLGSVLKKRKTIPYPEAVDIIKQIIDGYIDVNSSGYLHRDIKPANIFYVNSTYKIGDFGFAIPAQEIDQHKNYNVGSPVYMPPEALKENLYSISCDTWAIGIIFFQMLKGVVPWRAISEQKLHEKLVTEPLEHITSGLPEVSRQFLARVLHLDPKARMNIQEMKTWISKLSTVEIVPLPLYNGNALKEIKNFQNQNQTILKPAEIKSIFTPKQIPRSNNNPVYFNPPMTQKNISHEKISFPKHPRSPSPLNEKTSQMEIEDTILKEAGVFGDNLASYLKFMHKVIKFVNLNDHKNFVLLVCALEKNLLEQLQLFYSFILNPASCMIERWEQFLDSKRGKQLKSKFAKMKSKYQMVHDLNGSSPDLSEDLLKEGIKDLLENLERTGFNQRKVVSADYLTTMFQLWHLRNKYGLLDFLKMSKIDLIMQGDPYNANEQNLAQLKLKISLIDLFQ